MTETEDKRQKLPCFLFISLHPNVVLHYFSMQICSISGQIFESGAPGGTMEGLRDTPVTTID